MLDAITPQPVAFDGLFPKPLVAAFDQSVSSSDAGAVLLRAADEQLGLTRHLAAALVDARAAGRVQHSLHDLLRQRVYAIACGFEDGNDAARLRHEPLHKLLLDRDPITGADLASQPTLSRFENGFSARSALRLARALGERVIEQQRARRRGKARRITIDLDGTDDPTFGAQQGSFFHGYYGHHCLLPLLAFMQFDSEAEQHLLSAVLRPGNAHGSDGAVPLLKRLLPSLRRAFPKARLRLRLDGGFAHPSVFTYLEREGLEYVCAIASNEVLKRLAADDMALSRAHSAESGESERRFGHGRYRAKGWPHARRVVYKAEVVHYRGRDARDNARYLITNLHADPEVIYRRVYAARGDIENRIKELLHGVALDRLSCSDFLANQARLILHAAAYVLYQEVRHHARGTDLAHAQVTTLRERLIKLAGSLHVSAKRITLHLPTTAPWRNEWAHIAHSLNTT